MLTKIFGNISKLASQRTASKRGLDKDKETTQSDKGSAAKNYLDSPKPKTEPSSIIYRKVSKNVKQKMSDPSESGNESMLVGTNNDMKGSSEPGTTSMPNRRYTEDNLISTIPTPTSEKLGYKRPGVSTFVTGVAYNPDTKQMNIKYRDGAIFPYHNVSPETVESIVYADSIGREVLDTVFTGHGTDKNDRIGSLFKGMKRKGMEVNP